jgi:ferredoxin
MQDVPSEDHCGTCTLCLDACPTGAITEPYVVDANKCISYATIELRDAELPEPVAAKLNGWLYGCDICQDVCPWNRFEQPTDETRFEPRPGHVSADLAEILELTPDTYATRFRRTSIKRAKLAGLQRNARALLKLKCEKTILKTEKESHMTDDGIATLDDTSTEITIEQLEDDTPLDVKPERRRVKTDKRDLPVETLFNWVTRNKVNPQPEFQRFFVWNNMKASRLIESLLLDIPIPVVYVAEEPDKTYSVVDGQQRITSICSYIGGKFPDGRDFALSNLLVLTELKGKLFRQLSTEQQEAILNATIRLIIIEHDSDPDVKFEVFERLNLGAEKLNDQELRNSVYRGKYNVLLRDLTSNPHLLKIMGAHQPHIRMLDRQLILRFFAMWRNTHLKYKAPIKQFLNREMENHRNPSDKELAELRAIFEKSIEMAYTVFGHNAFRRFNVGKAGKSQGGWESRKLNVALWDTLLYTFSYYDKSQIVPIADAIREEFLDVLTNDETFIEYISSSTDKPDRIQYRAETWRQRLQTLVSSKEPRTFSLALKERLFAANPTCQICNQRIRDVDDSEVDHIKHYWRGGKNIEENARLTHRYCNRARGGRD